MKDNMTNVVRKAIGVFGLILTISTVTLYAQRESVGGRLEGTWDAFVSLRNCETDAVIGNPFASIASFNKGGTTIGSTSGMPQSARTPEHGIWKHVSGNIYMFRFKTFNFNPMGVNTGYAIITHELELDSGADTYTSGGIAQFFLPNGIQVGQGCSTAVGTRFAF